MPLVFLISFSDIGLMKNSIKYKRGPLSRYKALILFLITATVIYQTRILDIILPPFFEVNTYDDEFTQFYFHLAFYCVLFLIFNKLDNKWAEKEREEYFNYRKALKEEIKSELKEETETEKNKKD